MSRETAPPGVWPPPERAALAGESVERAPLAAAIADRYFERHPEDLEHYGDAARAWEVHDTLHLLNWAIGDVEGHVELDRQASASQPGGRSWSGWPARPGWCARARAS